MNKILYFTVGVIILSSIFFNENIIRISEASFGDGLNNTGAGAGYNTVEAIPSLPLIVGKALSILTIFLGIVFLGLMIYAGYLWMMARGNEQDIEKAKNIIIYAVIGLVVVLAAYAIVKLIIPIWNLVKAN